MAITIQQEPANELLSATLDSNALLYVVDIVVTTASATRPAVDAVLQVAYEVNGSVIDTEQYNDSLYSYIGANQHKYTFTFDAQENVQAYFGQGSDPLLDLFRGLHSTSAQIGYHAKFRLVLDEWIPNASDFLVLNSPAQVISSYRNAIDSVLHHEDIQNLNDFDNQILLADANWLTEKPISLRAVCRTDDEQLAGWAMGGIGDVIGMTFKGYNSAGVQISVGAINGLSALQNGITVFPVGPQNIINTVGWAIVPPVLPSSPLMKYYTVKISTANKSIEQTYYLLDGCCPKHRLYFKNRLGFYDTFDIPDVDIQSYNTQSFQFEKNRGFEHSPIARGNNKVLTVGKDSWQMIRIKMSKEQAMWAKQLLLSPNVFMQTYTGALSPAYYLRPVVVRDGDVKIYDNVDKPSEFSFVVETANYDKSQRN